MSQDTSIRLVIAEDHGVTQSGLHYLLDDYAEFTVVAMVATGETAIQRTTELLPDVLILDLALPGMSGLHVIDRLKQTTTPTGIVVYSGQTLAIDFVQASQGGARGLVSKNDDPTALIDAIRTVARGGRYTSPNVTRLIAPLGHLAPTKHRLTSRERQVLVLVAQGLRNQMIADELHISPETIKKHRSNLRRKLGINSTAEATVVAISLGLVTAERK